MTFIVIPLLVVIILLLTKTGKSCLSGIIGLVFCFVVVALFLGNRGCNVNEKAKQTSTGTPPETPGVKEPPYGGYAVPSATVGSTIDTLYVRKKLKELGKVLDVINLPTIKAMHQFQRFCTAYANGEASAYEVYQTAEVAKNQYEKAQEDINGIEQPEKLPKELRDTLNIVMSDIATFYMVKKEAFEQIMEMIDADKVSYSKLEKISTNTDESLVSYNRAMMRLAIINMSFGVSYQKQVKKKQPVINKDSSDVN